MCGLIGIAGSPDAAAFAIEGLHTQQFRGLESAGVAAANGSGIHLRGGLGLVQHVFSQDTDVLGQLPGDLAIGHVRYSTVSKDTRNSRLYQPIRGRYGDKGFCLAHNGNITNTAELLRYVESSRMETSVDSELIARLLENSCTTGNIEEDLGRVCAQLRGAYCLLILFQDEIIAVRDPQGVHPLSLGVRDDGTIIIASETCAFETLDAKWLRDVAPGTLVRVQANRSIRTCSFARPREKKCIFQTVYFAHPASTMFGEPVLDWRTKVGVAMERALPTPGADIVVPVPDSAVAYGIGYGASGRSGTYLPALTRNHYVGRTFILPSQDQREAAVRRKFQASVPNLTGKKVVLIDDSIVRGTTMRRVVNRLKAAGALEVHVISAFDRIRHPCLYGVDTPEKTELIASTHTVDEACTFIGATSLRYFDLQMMLELAGGPPRGWCTACVTGEYWHKDAA